MSSITGGLGLDFHPFRRMIMAMDFDKKPPLDIKLGKAKALEVVVLSDGTRLQKKTKVRYWLERTGAREDFFLKMNEKVYQLTTLEFKRRFKILIKAGVVRHPV